MKYNLVTNVHFQLNVSISIFYFFLGSINENTALEKYFIKLLNLASNERKSMVNIFIKICNSFMKFQFNVNLM